MLIMSFDHRPTSLVLAAALATACLAAAPAAAAPAAAASAPSAAAAAGADPAGANAIFRPVFNTPQGALEAGTAFIAHLDRCKEPVLLTALHLFGPAGGLRESMEGDDVRHGVTHAELTGFGRGARHMLFEVGSLTPDDAQACCHGQAMHGVGDVAAFTAPEYLDAIALRMAAAPAEPGQHVTLLAEVVAPANAGLRHGAVVLGMHDGFLMYKFDDPTLDLRATSGAPVVDDAGKVVALNLSSGHTLRADPAAVVGGGNPTAAWRDAVAAGCQPR